MRRSSAAWLPPRPRGAPTTRAVAGGWLASPWMLAANAANAANAAR